jgi:phosphatidyl-myo-inositol dimannoside synthase
MANKETRTLLITRNLPPLRGGMERLNLHLALALGSIGALAVSGPMGCGNHLSLVRENLRETRHRPLSLFLIGCALASLRIAWRYGPTLVVAGSGLTAPQTFLVSRITGARSVVYLHGLDLIADSRIYQTFWIPLIRRMHVVLVNSRNTAQLAVRAGVAPERIHVLHPGTDVPGYDPAAGRTFREHQGLGERPLLLSIGRLTRRKGIAEFVERALPPLLKKRPETLLLVIGADAQDAIHNGHDLQLERIKRCAADAGVAEAIRFLPSCDDTTLSAAYNAADVHVFPVRELARDVEGFGMVAIEAAARGLPTVAFDSGGVADAVVDGRSGDLVAPDDYVALASAIGRRLDTRGDDVARRACVDVARSFDWSHFTERLRALLADTMSGPSDDSRSTHAAP